VDYSGTSAANFLKLGVGARLMAMGDAAITVVNDASALYWNPAAVTRIDKQASISMSTMNWLVNTRHSYIGAVLDFGTVGFAGIDIQYMDYGKIEETTVYDQDGTGRYYYANDVSLGLAYARSLTDRFSFGIKIKYVSEKLANVSASAFAFDIGALFKTSFLNNRFRIAATLSNFGSKMQFTGRDLSIVYTIPGNPSNKQIPANLETMSWELPLLFRFGISNYFIENEIFTVLAAYDILDSRDYKVRHNLGIEFGYQKLFFLRGGYKINYDELSYTAGLGLNLAPVLGYDLSMDYVFLDYGVFETIHGFTFIVNF
jgi:hypothetical protein